MLYRIQHLDLPERPFFVLALDGTLTADFNSTLFNQQSEFLGSYSYPGTMPLEPNRALIRNAHYINSSNKQRTINAMMWLGATPFKQVKLYFTIENGTINYNLYYDLSLISNLLKTLKLFQTSDLSGELIFESTAALKDYMTATTTGTKGQYPMVFFPFKNDGAYIDAAYEFEPAFNSAISYTSGQKFTYLPNGQIYEVTATTSAGETPISTPAKFNNLTSSYSDNAFPASKIINRWELADDGSSSFIVDTASPVRQTQSPAFYLVYVLQRVAAFLGFTLEGDWLNDDDANKIVIWSNAPIGTVEVIPDFAFFMPDVLLTDFLKTCRTEFGLLISPDPLRGVLVVESIKNIERRSEVVDLSGVQTVSYRETGTQAQSFVITQGYDDKDSAWSDSEKKTPLQLAIGDLAHSVQQTDIAMASAQTKMIQEQSAVPIFESSPIVSNWRIPWIKMPVVGSTPMDQISTIKYADTHSFGLRFLIYHGMTEDDSGYLYPYASNDNLNQNLESFSDFTLSLDALPGSSLNIKDYYTFLLNSKPFEMVFELWPWQFMQITSNKRVFVKDFNQAKVECLIDQVSADFTNNKEKIVAKLTLYPRIWPDNDAEVLPPVVVPTPPPPYDNGTVYVRLSLRNPTTYTSPIPPHDVTHQKDIYVQFFEDAAATIPKDVISLDVKLETKELTFETVDGVGVHTYNCTSTGHENLLQANAPIDEFVTTSGNQLTWQYRIVPTTDYTVL